MTTGLETDEALMAMYQRGDAKAFEVLYARHRGGLYRYFLRQCGVAAVAEELYQDVWTNLIRTRERYEVRAKFTTFLYRLAHNRLVDHYRRQASGLPMSYDADGAEESIVDSVADSPQRQPENELDARRQAKQLQKLIEALPEAQREAFLLSEEGDLSLKEIAHIMGVNAETAKSRLRYAIAKLRAGMKSGSTQKAE